LANADWMRNNLESLTVKNKIFSHELEELHKLPEPIALEARSLGYIANNEIVVRIASAQPVPVFTADPGTMVVYQKDSSLNDVEIKGIAMVMTCITGLAMLVLYIFTSGKRQPLQRATLAHDESRV